MVLSPRKSEVISTGVQLNYYIALPQGYDGVTEWPLIVFLHGAGERGDDLSLVAKHGLPRRLYEGEDVPFIVVAPQCPAQMDWSYYAFPMMAFIQQIVHHYPVKTNQVYLTGLSMGGYGTWDLGRLFPSMFAAIAPICGGMPWLVEEETAAQQLKNTPVWAFHGALDTIVPVTESRRMVKALQDVGATVKYTEYPDLEHNSWTVTYNNPDLYTWFLQQSL
ncbi:MAG: hypothetical protein OHK0046_40990 [Anaerolineae bacterium]